MLTPKRTILAEAKKRFGEEQLPLLLAFSADWCPACVEQKSLLTKLEKEFDGRVKFIRINIDYEDALKVAAGIKAIPALIIINSEKSRGGIIIGPQSEAKLRSFVAKATRI